MADYDAFESAAPSQVEKLLLAPSDMDSAVVSRSTVKFRPQGTSTYGSGSRTMQFRLSSSDYASLDTLTFGFKLTRKYANCVQEDLFALSCIQDLRVEVGGVVCEDLRGVNRCIKPLIYAGVDESYLRGDLTHAGSYKYVPTYNGVFAANVDAATLTSQAAETGSATIPVVDAGDVFNGQLKFVGIIPPAADPPTQAQVNKIITQRCNSPYMAFLAHPAEVSTTTEGLDLGVAGIYVPADANLTKSTNLTAYNNYSCANYLGKAIRPNSMPIDYGVSDAYEADAGKKARNSAAGLTRDYQLPMKLIMGLCRCNSYFVLRNVGSLLIEITLAPYEQMFIHTSPLVQDSAGNSTRITADAATLTSNATALAQNRDYVIQSPYMQCDIVRCSDAVVSRVDEMCSSSGGYSLPFETYSCQTTPFQYTSQLSLTYSRAFSKLKDVWTCFQQQESASNLHLSKSDYYMGSRYRSHHLTVGSTNFPVVDVDSPSECWSELLKTFSHMGTSRGSVVDRATWLGERSEFAENQFSVAGYMPDIRLANLNNEASMRAATGLATQAPSCALFGSSLERVLSQSGATYGSGISTRASGMQLTHEFQFQEWSDTSWMGGTGSLLDPRYLDAHLGNSRMLCYTTFHIDGLLRIANDAVSVSV